MLSPHHKSLLSRPFRSKSSALFSTMSLQGDRRGRPPFSSRRPIMEHGTIFSHASQLEQLVLDALQDMQRLGYSPNYLRLCRGVWRSFLNFARSCPTAETFSDSLVMRFLATRGIPTDGCPLCVNFATTLDPGRHADPDRVQPARLLSAPRPHRTVGEPLGSVPGPAEHVWGLLQESPPLHSGHHALPDAPPHPIPPLLGIAPDE